MKPNSLWVNICDDIIGNIFEFMMLCDIYGNVRYIDRYTFNFVCINHDWIWKTRFSEDGYVTIYQFGITTQNRIHFNIYSFYESGFHLPINISKIFIKKLAVFMMIYEYYYELIIKQNNHAMYVKYYEKMNKKYSKRKFVFRQNKNNPTIKHFNTFIYDKYNRKNRIKIFDMKKNLMDSNFMFKEYTKYHETCNIFKYITKLNEYITILNDNDLKELYSILQSLHFQKYF